ncbi:MAG: hypothetical protein QM485_03880 [Flavobacteriaceae bacterium]
MKIRIKGNSIRYRLTKTEVATFCKTGYVEESTQFSDSSFTYAVKAKDDIEHLEAAFDSGSITLFVPKKESTNWVNSNRVGFQHNLFSDDDSSLSLLLEKDFSCLDNTIEDQSDNYPNPLADRK